MGIWHDQNIEELQEALADKALEESDASKIGGILSSKSLVHAAEVVTDLGNTVVRETHRVIREAQKMETRVEKLSRTLAVMIRANRKLFWAVMLYSIVIALLACVIAFSTLVQAGLINLG